MVKTLDVYLNAELAGLLSQNTEHEMAFTYSRNATRIISIGMPIAKNSFGAAHCEAFFGGLLPEGDGARRALARRFGTSTSNTFSLLQNIGAECAGALSIVAPGQIIAAEGPEDVQLLPTSELAQHIRELPQRPLFVDVKGMRLSLAGVQDKASVSLVEGVIGLPKSGPTTHILKPDLGHAPGVIYCEHLCMKIASRIGIDAASVNLATAEDQVYLLVERYDRVKAGVRKQGSEKIDRIHQEDFCQALAIPSGRKYQEDGGPKLVDCFALLNQTTLPARDRLRLLTAVVFNFLSGNMDAHAKNFSLLHDRKGICLAPMYDVICTLAFPDFSTSLAMDIGDYFESENINAHEWRTLCGDIQYSFPAFKKLAKKLCATIPDAAREEHTQMQAAGWSHPACDRALEIILANCQQMKDRLSL